MADPISAVGTLASSGFGSAHLTQAFTPTKVGNAIVFGATVAGTGITVATVSGGGVTTWVRIVAPVQFTSPNVATQSMEMWLGVITAAGSSTITITTTSSTTNSGLYAQEFGCVGGGPGTIWAVVAGQTGSTNNSTAGLTIQFPTLTPSGLFRAYVGVGYAGAQASTSGATAGYTSQIDANSNPFLYNPSVANSAQSPTCVTTSGKSNTVAALITATNPTPRPILATPLAPRLRSVNY